MPVRSLQSLSVVVRGYSIFFCWQSEPLWRQSLQQKVSGWYYHVPHFAWMGGGVNWRTRSDEATDKWLCFSVVPGMGQPLIKVHTPRPRPSACENTLCCTTTTHWSRSSDGFQTHTLTCSLGSGFFPKSGIISPTGRIHPYVRGTYSTVTTLYLFCITS